MVIHLPHKHTHSTLIMSVQVTINAVVGIVCKAPCVSVCSYIPAESRLTSRFVKQGRTQDTPCRATSKGSRPKGHHTQQLKSRCTRKKAHATLRVTDDPTWVRRPSCWQHTGRSRALDCTLAVHTHTHLSLAAFHSLQPLG